MKDYNLQLNCLFDEWIKRSEENGERYAEYNPNEILFTKDGLVYKNGIDTHQTDADWQMSDKRIMFIVKDQNTNDSDYVRLWLKDTVNDTQRHRQNKEKNRMLCNVFLHKIANLFWGLSKADADNDWWYDEVNQHKEDVRDFFNACPFALVEAKKQPGGPTIDNNALKNNLSIYGDLLLREIDILAPNIIVCMGHPIYGFVLKEFAKLHGNLKKHHKNIHTTEDGITIIYAGHPSARGSFKDHYEGVMWHYRTCYLKTITQE